MIMTRISEELEEHSQVTYWERLHYGNLDSIFS